MRVILGFISIIFRLIQKPPIGSVSQLGAKDNDLSKTDPNAPKNELRNVGYAIKADL